MGVFLFPKSFCSELNNLIGRYWQQKNKGKKGMHLLNWSKMCLPKDKGGMGFRELWKFNQALVTKQGWRLLKNETSLTHTVLKTKYFPTSSFLKADLGRNPSLIWRNIWETKGILNKGLRWRVGNGTKFCIWKDKWLWCNTSLKPTTIRTDRDQDERLNSFIHADTKVWNTRMLEEVFSPAEASFIRTIPLSKRGADNVLVWHFNKTGFYIVKSGYLFLCNEKEEAQSPTYAHEKDI
ncbi:hypothetical protein PTKIN_Ptkin11bG0087000 [Pterospermum kingtungense]